MILFSGNTVTSYGVTARGNFYEHHKTDKGQIFRATGNPITFLGWITKSEELILKGIEDQKNRKNKKP